MDVGTIGISTEERTTTHTKSTQAHTHREREVEEILNPASSVKTFSGVYIIDINIYVDCNEDGLDWWMVCQRWAGGNNE